MRNVLQLDRSPDFRPVMNQRAGHRRLLKNEKPDHALSIVRLPYSLCSLGFLEKSARPSASEGKAANKGREISMRVFIACAIILSAAVGLGGCWGHHEKAVVAEPLKLG